MKKRYVFAGLTAVCAVVVCIVMVWTRGSGKQMSDGSKMLVVYFSMPETGGVDASSSASRIVRNGMIEGNTEYVAKEISGITGADLFEIKSVRTYSAESHQALINAAKASASDEVLPALATQIENLTDYEVVFVGFPNWRHNLPQPLYAFFDEYDLSGKTVVPFCTSGGSGAADIAGITSTIRRLEPHASVLDGYVIAREDVPNSHDAIAVWLGQTGMRQ